MRRTEGPDPPAENPLLGIRGIGPARLRKFARLGISTIEEALLHLPRRYEDRRRLLSIADIADGQTATVLGNVVESRIAFSPGKRRRTFEVRVDDGSAELRARWFHYRGLPQSPLFRKGSDIYLYGTFRVAGGVREMIHPAVEDSEEKEGTAPFRSIVPFYPAVEGLSPGVMRTLMSRIVNQGLGGEEEFLPPTVLQRQRLPGRAQSLRALHFPPGDADLDDLNEWRTEWHRRLIFEELFLLQVGLERRRVGLGRSRTGPRLEHREKMVGRLRESLPFSLTGAQARAYGEIAEDLASSRCMHRLLQGDVGSGKTLVAIMACLQAADNGRQAALMAPTEILAGQHYLTITELTSPLGLRTALLTSGRPGEERRAVAEGLASGSIDLAIGTHALIQSGVRFRSLALAVIDEQHRFGVRQRLSLRRKGNHPHLLVMTATPIPRTLALTLYGDLDCTIIDALPPGRTPVTTKIGGEASRGAVYERIREELSRGQRAYVVLPLIDEGENADLRTVTGTAEMLRRKVFPEFAVGILHGRMPLEEREKVMEDFRSGRTNVLVTTTVVEVGVDVPAATVMLIEHAERFGLSQMHQLRGRIGRGRAPSTCYLMTHGRPGETAQRRLDIMAATNDGFRIAEEDLSIRGPGEFFGTRQSGLPRLQVADLLRDRHLLEEARREAARLLAEDGDLTGPGHRLLRQRVNSAWSRKFFLAAAG